MNMYSMTYLHLKLSINSGRLLITPSMKNMVTSLMN